MIEVMGYRIGYTTKKEGRYVDPAPEGLFARKQMSMINDESNKPSPDKKVAFEAADLIEGAVKNTKQTININSSKRDGPLYPGWQGKHRTGEAFDINKINNHGAGERGNASEVAKLQQEFNNPKHRNIFELTLGPLNPKENHPDHVHVQTNKEQSADRGMLSKIKEFVFPSN
jgi:hypothetical protein